MKNKVAKVFKKYGEGEIKIIKRYSPKTKRPETTAITCSRKDFNKCIGRMLLKGSKEERTLVGTTLNGDFYEDFNAKTRLIVKY